MHTSSTLPLMLFILSSLTEVTARIDGAPTRIVDEGDSIDICVSKDIESVRGVNFELLPQPGSAGSKMVFDLNYVNIKWPYSVYSCWCFHSLPMFT